MNGRKRSAVFRGIIAILFFLSPARAQYTQIYRPYFQKQFSRIQHITTFPDDDTEPVVSPDGRWLAFTSARSGNRDIWLKSVHGGQAFQLTIHKADDYSPCWAADNRTIYFISNRSDAKGDLWQLRCKPAKLPDGNIQIRQIDNYLGYDGEPACSPDGKWIALTSTRLTGERNIWLIDPASQNVIPFTFTGGFSPAWSPTGNWLAYTKIHRIDEENRQHIFLKRFFSFQSFSEMNMEDTDAAPLLSRDVNEAFPVWGINDSTLFFLRYENDTNGDDRFDFTDRSTLVRLSLSLPAADSSGAAGSADSVAAKIPVSSLTSLFPANREVLYPAISQDRLFFSLRESGHFNICAVPHSGIIPVFASAREQFEWADSSFSLSFLTEPEEDDSLSALELSAELKAFHANRLLAFLVVRQRFNDDSRWRILAGLEVAAEHIRAGEKKKAIRLYQQMLQAVDRRDPLFVRIKLHLWQVCGLPRQRWRRAPDSLRYGFAGNVSAQREIARFEAELAYRNGEMEPALALLRKSLNTGPRTGESFLQNLFLQANIFRQTGNDKSALKDYLLILKSANNDIWRQRACAKIISVLKKGSDKKGSDFLKNAMENYREYPRLIAEIHIVRGKLFRKNNDYRRALSDLQTVLQKFPREKTANLKAAVFISEIYAENKQNGAAVQICRRILNRDDLNIYERTFFLERIRQLQFEIAEQMRKNGQTAAAFAQYQRLLQEKPDNIKVLQGLITCGHKLQILPSLEKEFSRRLKEKPGEQSMLYALGLLYSVQYQNDRKELTQANDYLEQALNRDFRLIPAYLALSNNYVKLEVFQQQELARKRSLLIRAARQILGPAIWLYRIITLRKAAELQNWYEKAIRLLNLAVSLNDEKTNPKQEARLYLKLADIYYDMGDFGHEKAYDYFLRRQQLDATFSDVGEEAAFFFRLGHAAISVRDWHTAVSALNRADVLYSGLVDLPRKQQIEKLLALIYQSSGDFKKSIEKYRKTLASDQKQKNKRAVLETYRNIAYNYLLLENEKQVRQYCLRVLNILKDKKLKKRYRPSSSVRLEFLGYSIPLWSFGNLGPSTARELYGFSVDDERALIYTLLAENEAQRGNYQQALQLLKEKLAVLRKEGDPLGQAIMINNIGMMHLALGNLTNAWRWFSISYKRCGKQNFLAGEVTNLLNICQMVINFSQHSHGDQLQYKDVRIDVNLVIRWIDETLTRLQTYPYSFIRERTELTLQRAVLSFLVFTLEIKKKPALRQKYSLPLFALYGQKVADLVDEFEHAADLARRNSLQKQQALAFNYLGELNRCVGLLPEAENYFQKANSLARANGFYNLQWQILTSLGQIQSLYTSSSDSLKTAYFRQAREILRREKISKPASSFDLSISKEMEFLYDALLKNYSENSDNVAALKCFEEYQGLLRLEMFHRVSLGKAGQKQNGNIKNYLEKLKEVNRLNDRLLDIQRSRRGGYRLFYDVLDSLIYEKQQLQNLVDELKANDPERLAIFRPFEFSLRDVKNSLNGDQVVLIYYATQNHLFSWCLTSDSLFTLRTQIAKPELKKRAGRFLRAVGLDSVSSEQGNSLGKILLQPFFQVLQRKKEWFIIPAAPLTGLPFEVLPFAKRPAAARHLIAYSSSLNDLRLSRLIERSAIKKGMWIGRQLFLHPEKEFPRLAFEKINAISVTESQFRRLIKSTGFIILNRPVIFARQPVLNSYIPFQTPFAGGLNPAGPVTANPDENDGFFYLRDLFSLHSRAAFVFSLFPEDTLTTGLPVLGVRQTAWRNAGIPSFLTLRWSVPPDIKKEFVSIFLSQLHRNEPFISFHNARNQLRRRHNKPSLWGAFVWRGATGGEK